MPKHINRHQTSQALGELIANFMETLFKEKEEDDLTYGLALLPAPTGSGKTHKIAEIMQEEKKTQFIYAVNTIENSNDIYHKLLEFYSKDEGLYAFNREVLRLKSNKDTLIEFFSSIPIPTLNATFNVKYHKRYQEEEEEESDALYELKRIQSRENEEALEYLTRLSLSQFSFKGEDLGFRKKRDNHHELKILIESIHQNLKVLMKRTLSLISKSTYDEEYDFHKEKLDEANRACRKVLIKFYELLEKEKPSSQTFILHASKIFPTLNIDEYRVVVLTTSKLLLPIITKDGSRHLYKPSEATLSSYGAKRLLIMDEFDLQMGVLLSHIVNEDKEVIDKAQLFLTLHKRLDKHQFSPYYALHGAEDKELERRKNKLVSLLSNLERSKEKALKYLRDREGEEQYYYNFSFEVDKEDRNSTLKSDDTQHLEDNIYRLYIHIDHKRKSYVIYQPKWKEGELLTDTLKSNSDKKYYEFMREVNAYLGFLAKTVAPWLIYERERTLRAIYKKNEANMMGVESKKVVIPKTKEEEFKISARRDVLRDFGINKEDNPLQYHFFNQKLDENSRMNAMQNKFIMQNDENFYLKGLSLLNVKHPRYKRRGELNPLTSYMSDLGLETTPEGKLIDILSSIPILGISATSTIPTVSANFDIKFLEKCGVAVHLPSKEEIEQIRQFYIDDHQQDERQFIINKVSPFFPNSPFDELTLAINDSTMRGMDFDTKERTHKEWIAQKKEKLLLKLYDYLLVKEEERELFYHPLNMILNKRLSGKVTENLINQALSYAFLYTQFLQNDKMKSFILFLPRGMDKEKKSAWWSYFGDEDNNIGLGSLFKVITDTHYAKKFPSSIGRKKRAKAKIPKWEEIVFGVVSSNKKRAFKEIHHSLAQGNKAFVFSTYATLGAGANIDYEIEGVRKDFDAIFLEKPTYVYGSVDSNNNQLEHLYYLNKLYYNRFLSRENKNILTKRAITSSNSHYHKNNAHYFKSADMINYIANILSQATGRTHRVNNKEDDLYIFVDNALLEYLAHFDTSLVPTLPSFYNLVVYAKEQHNEEAKEFHQKESPFSLVAKNSSRLNSTVKSLLKEFWENNTRNIKIYDEYRKQLLKAPTKKEGERLKFALYLDFILESVKKYFYLTEDDHQSYLYIGQEHRKGSVEVSEAKCGLCYVSQVPLLKKHFEENHYALSFEGYLPLPKPYNDYKGVLGEEIGEVLFKKVGIELQKFYDEKQREKIEYVEFADFYIGENKEVLIDFKNFAEGTKWRTKTSELFAKAERKRVAIREGKGGNAGRLTLIVNIFKQEESNVKEDKVSDNGAIHYIPYLIDTTQEIPTINYQALREIKERIALVVEDTPFPSS